jgi:hypothetical protein
MRAALFGLGGRRLRGDVYRSERLSPESVPCRCRKIEICTTGDGSAPICKGASVLGSCAHHLPSTTDGVEGFCPDSLERRLGGSAVSGDGNMAAPDTANGTRH